MFPAAIEDKEAKLRFKDKNGNSCPYVVADTPLSKRLSGLTQIMDDLNHAHELMSMISKIDNDEVAYSLWMSAIVTYGKCFATASGRRSKLEETHVTRVDPGALDFHKSIIEMRNEYFAHAGLNDYEKSSVIVILSPDYDEKKVLAVNHFNAKHTKPSEDFCIYFCHLCRELYKVVENIGYDVHERVLLEHKNMDVNQLYARIKT